MFAEMMYGMTLKGNTEVIIVTAVVVMIHALAIMDLDVIKRDRFCRFWNVNGWDSDKD